MSLTDPQRAALAVLVERTNVAGTRTLSARQVAKALWPDSPAWQRPTARRGAGGGGAGVYGGTMPMKAGALLSRLRDAGVADDDDRAWHVTWLGVEVAAGRREPITVERATPAPAERRPKTPRCHYCKTAPGVTKDHVVPRARGGPDEEWNIVPACQPCNQQKANRWTTCLCDFCLAAIARFAATQPPLSVCGPIVEE